MRTHKIFYDRHGSPIRKGDTIKLVDIPLELFLGLSESEQKTLRAEIGKMHLIQSANQLGKLELEFFDARGISHTIFIRPACVTRIPG
jgi:hypothetical protein